MSVFLLITVNGNDDPFVSLHATAADAYEALRAAYVADYGLPLNADPATIRDAMDSEPNVFWSIEERDLPTSGVST